MSKTSESKVAIIGLGNIGQVVATNLTKGNRPVILASRDYSQAKSLAEKVGNLAQPMEISAALQEADIIILAIWFSSIKEFLNQYAKQLEGKIIIDPSNPIAPDGKGGFIKTIDATNSAGQINKSLLPKGARLAKALGTLGAASLANASGQKPKPAVLFYATDDQSINTKIEELIWDTGFEPLYVGNLDQSIRIEVFGELHEFGALGKTVTADEIRRSVAV
ncbi:NAD(P)-binding domain-containing protein [Cytophagaceae bacterium DM2B3-1]|uniref:NAD(P)-binding domain-containing protein n=1 Tax=Xanthocytophaga flava TaxID=3048013 RepID=A0ABT7CGP8_9BACT|nr:NAD(P)-binding domain-containing protein [Xanthocytophaga flavus]MDJ1492919.1 NAD(P)-binding domain-containing protein [Xanthocytophaga flavus]